MEPIGYVVMEDRFLSGWGEAKNGKSVYAVAVYSAEDASIVEDNARRRSEMKRVRFNLNLPRVRAPNHLSVNSDAESPWHKRGAF